MRESIAIIAAHGLFYRAQRKPKVFPFMYECASLVFERLSHSPNVAPFTQDPPRKNCQSPSE